MFEDARGSCDMASSVAKYEQLSCPKPTFDLLVSPFWSSFSHGPKRLTFDFWVLWASEAMATLPLFCFVLWRVQTGVR